MARATAAREAAGGGGGGAPRGIVTPEAVVLEFETAGTGSRLLAALLDVVVITVATWGLFMVLGLGAGFGGALFPDWAAIVFIVLLLFSVFFGYWIGFETWNSGRTPGKTALGLRVVTVEGGPISFRHAAIRGFFRLIDFYLTSGVVGVLTTTLSRRDQRLGDQFAGTIVLRERALGTSLGALTFPAPQGYEAYVATLDVAALTPAQYGVIRNYLARVFQVTPAARAALAVRLAERVQQRTSQPIPSMMHPELYLACVASAYQQRHPRHLGAASFGAGPAPVGQQALRPPTGTGAQWRSAAGGAPGMAPPPPPPPPPPPTAAPVRPGSP